METIINLTKSQLNKNIKEINSRFIILTDSPMICHVYNNTSHRLRTLLIQRIEIRNC